MFPIQSERGADPHPLRIPWDVAELAYSVYSARYGRDQSLERMAERGGFGPSEMDMFLPDWRERVCRIRALEVELSKSKEHAAILLETLTSQGSRVGALEARVEALEAALRNMRSLLTAYAGPVNDGVVEAALAETDAALAKPGGGEIPDIGQPETRPACPACGHVNRHEPYGDKAWCAGCQEPCYLPATSSEP